MAAGKRSRWRAPRRVLVIDIGGSHVKFRVGPRGRADRFESGPKLTAGAMAARVTALVPRDRYDAVSIGYPGLVFHGRITAEPHNLGHGWVHFDFAAAFGAPVRLINDAAMQAIGSYEGGRMLFLGLGTGLGATLILDGVVEPMELGHMPYRKGRTYEDYIGERGRLRAGTRKWRRQVHDIVVQLGTVLEVDYVVIGGGNAKRLKTLPPRARLGNNNNAFAGGMRIWRYAQDPLILRA
ncbi:MAG TPA: ROK family protein [Steroidobacteraceae bacterium]|nr:ROK family protein [Steroidobacteraceae bacterium]